MATRVGSASALNCAASWSRSWTASGSVAGPQQIAGRVAIDFIELLRLYTSTDVDERRRDELLRRRLRLWLRLLLDVEADVQNVTVLNLVGLALEALEAGPGGLRVRAGLDEVVPADHLSADEAARDVGVNRRRGIERSLAAS